MFKNVVLYFLIFFPACGGSMGMAELVDGGPDGSAAGASGSGGGTGGAGSVAGSTGLAGAGGATGIAGTGGSAVGGQSGAGMGGSGVDGGGAGSSGTGGGVGGSAGAGTGGGTGGSTSADGGADAFVQGPGTSNDPICTAVPQPNCPSNMITNECVLGRTACPPFDQGAYGSCVGTFCCAGCVDAQGRCLVGDDSKACGGAGANCSACTTQQPRCLFQIDGKHRACFN